MLRGRDEFRMFDQKRIASGQDRNQEAGFSGFAACLSYMPSPWTTSLTVVDMTKCIGGMQPVLVF
jgi:hypothetical protein